MNTFRRYWVTMTHSGADPSRFAPFPRILAFIRSSTAFASSAAK